MLKPRGIHHITLICRDMGRTVKFYTEVLGLRLVKRTVNYDDPSTKHFFFGDEVGTPSTLLTFFEYPEGAQGRRGVGVAHHLALMVEDERELLAWKDGLEGRGIPVSGPIDRTYFKSLYFQDPDGVIIELSTRGPGLLLDEDPEELGKRMILPGESLQEKERP